MSVGRPSQTWHAGLTACACFCLALLAAGRAGAELTVTAQTEGNEFLVGESFLFQISVSGADATPEPPDMSALRDFGVEDLGSRQSSSTSVNIVNGRVTRSVQRATTFNYRLTPRRAGVLTIPALHIVAGGRAASTPALQVTAQRPQRVDLSELRLELSRTTCTVGEPVILRVTWSIDPEARDIRAAQFTLPVLEDEAFAVPQTEPATVQGRHYVRVLVNGRELIAERGTGSLNGRACTTVGFELVLVPVRPGDITMPESTVAFQVLAGQRSPQPRGERFGMLDDFFGTARQNVYRTMVVPSNRPTLVVRDLPAAGRPADFAGHVGTYRISTAATPTAVSVGDPITLTITLEGPAYIDHVQAPNLERQAELNRDFLVSREPVPGRVEGKAKVFTQTIRARHAQVTRIPPIELPIFDTDGGDYRVVRSAAIPVQVRAAAKVVTAEDVEGFTQPSAAGRALEVWTRGIAHNYEDAALTRDQRHGPEAWLDSPVWRLLLIVPPLGYAALLAGALLVRRQRADPAARQARRAGAECLRMLRAAAHDAQRGQTGETDAPAAVLAALRLYLGRRLRLPCGALTFADVAAPLRGRGVDEPSVAELETLFDGCEAGRYAGRATPAAEPAELIGRAARLVTHLERRLE